jgi:hypothetical protein
MEGEESSGDQWPDAEWFAGKPISQEGFEDLLLRIRNAASTSLAGFSIERIKTGEAHEAVIEDQRAVWHAAEVGLAVLLYPGYVPKREALADMRALLDMYGKGGDSG